MLAHKLHVNIPPDHHIDVRLPADFPSGPAEVIVLAAGRSERRIVKLSGALATHIEPALPQDQDLIAEALDELRQDRSSRLNQLEAELGADPDAG